METVYEWLLHNVGNEGNYLTILNTRRQTDEAGLSGLRVMARTKDFEVLNLLVRPAETSKESVPLATDIPNPSTRNTYFFETDQATITYLATGSRPDKDATGPGIEVVVLSSADDAGEIIFPPER